MQDSSYTMREAPLFRLTIRTPNGETHQATVSSTVPRSDWDQRALANLDVSPEAQTLKSAVIASLHDFVGATGSTLLSIDLVSFHTLEL